MSMINYINWTVDPELFTLGPLTVRWYGVLFGMAFFVGFYIMRYIYRNEKVSEQALDKLVIYMIIGTVAGARLGHVLFYDLELYLQNPIDIIKIWEGGLASHGAAIGIIVSLWIYSRKVSKINMFWILDRIVVVVALSGLLIRSGNLMNHEIYGEPTDAPVGFVFTQDYDDQAYYPFFYGTVENGHPVIHLDPDFARANGAISLYDAVHPERKVIFSVNNTPAEQPEQVFHDTFEDNDAQYYLINYDQRMDLRVVTRHPAQIYEALAYTIIFVFLLLYYRSRNGRIRPGFMFGWFLILVFTARFIIEFFKADQVAFEAGLPINMGQILSIPFVIGGIIILFMSLRREPLVYEGLAREKKKKAAVGQP